MESVAARIFRGALDQTCTTRTVWKDGLSIFGCVQLAVDNTVVSALHANGQARRNTARRDGVALEAARRRKERPYTS